HRGRQEPRGPALVLRRRLPLGPQVRRRARRPLRGALEGRRAGRGRARRKRKLKRPSPVSGRMSDTLTWVVRYVHILSALTWLGATMLFSMLIAPRVLRNGPPAIRRPFLEAILGPLTRYFGVAAGLTMLSGFLLVGQIYGYSNIGDAFQVKANGYGTALGIGVTSAILMAIVGFGIVGRPGAKMLATMQA